MRPPNERSPEANPGFEKTHTAGGEVQANNTSPFAAMPLNALNDRRLHEVDLRVLAAVAYFDRFGKNGTGCYATQTKLAAMTGCHERNVRAALGTLCRLGYLTRSRQKNRRRHQHHVVYQTGPVSPVSDDQNRAGESGNTGPVSPPKRSFKDIPLKRPSEKRDSPEGARSLRESRRPKNFFQQMLELSATSDAERVCEVLLADESVSMGKLRGLASQLERHAQKHGATNNALTFADALCQAGAELDTGDFGDNQATGHLERVLLEIDVAMAHTADA